MFRLQTRRIGRLNYHTAQPMNVTLKHIVQGPDGTARYKVSPPIRIRVFYSGSRIQDFCNVPHPGDSKFSVVNSIQDARSDQQTLLNTRSDAAYQPDDAANPFMAVHRRRLHSGLTRCLSRLKVSEDQFPSW